jgi:hypothetical protein
MAILEIDLESAKVRQAITAARPAVAGLASTNGVTPLYRRVGDTVELNAGVVTQPTPAGTRPAYARRSGRGSPGSTVPSGPFPPFPILPSAVLHGVIPSETRPAGRITAWGDGFADQVMVRVTHDLDPGIFDRYFQVKTDHTVEFHDWAVVTLPAETPAGRYRVAVFNPHAWGSNPGYITVKAPYPTRRYLVAQLEGLTIPTDTDNSILPWNGQDEGEMRFDFLTATGRGATAAGQAGLEIAKQHIAYGENDTEGFEVNERVTLVPSELQLPLFSYPYDELGDAVLFMAAGTEFDSTVGKGAWEAIGAVAGAAAGGLFTDTLTGALQGAKIGKEVADAVYDATADKGNQALGVYSTTWARDPWDFGLSAPEYPSSLQPFDPNNGVGKTIQIAHRSVSVEAPRVNRVEVTVDRIDVPSIPSPYGPPAFYVLARAFDMVANGEAFPIARHIELSPSSGGPGAKIQPPQLYLHDTPHDMPFVYVELALWARLTGPNGLSAGNRMLGRVYSRIHWPQQLLHIDQPSVAIPVSATVAPAQGHGTGFGGAWSVAYTIKVSR